MKTDWFTSVAVFVVASAFLYFGSGFLIHLYKIEVGKTAMQMRLDDYIDPAERLWILDRVHDELTDHHSGDPQLWSMTLVELINRPDKEFEGLVPGRLGLLRRIYMKLRISQAEG